jgi:DNA mismatch endonuclease Vsr
MMRKRTEDQISYNMSRVKSKGTAIEKIFANALKIEGLKHKKNYSEVIGKPDFVLLKQKTAIFCDSAFWHGYRNMKTKRHIFRSRKSFWIKKISQNIKRDKEY